MTSYEFLNDLSFTLQEIISDAEKGVEVCTLHSDYSLIKFMHMQQMVGVRRLMLPVAIGFNMPGPVNEMFDHYFRKLDDVKR